jgi:hypothetical protein
MENYSARSAGAIKGETKNTKLQMDFLFQNNVQNVEDMAHSNPHTKIVVVFAELAMDWEEYEVRRKLCSNEK